MLLINVRKGQFVYYNNELHKVYSVNPFVKQSVHLIRLYDLEQVLTTAREITYYRPKNLDSFIVNGKRYTLNRNTKAKVGNYILVINPKPDSLDHHHLHAMEMVSSIEENGVISNKSNSIKHNEYWVMEPGLLDGANVIDKLEPGDQLLEEDLNIVDSVDPNLSLPKIGDIYQKNDEKEVLQVMVVGLQGRTVFLGNGDKVQAEEIMESDNWSYVNYSREN